MKENALQRTWEVKTSALDKTPAELFMTLYVQLRPLLGVCFTSVSAGVAFLQQCCFLHSAISCTVTSPVQWCFLQWHFLHSDISCSSDISCTVTFPVAVPFPAQWHFLHSDISCTVTFPAQWHFLHSDISCSSDVSCTVTFPAAVTFPAQWRFL